MNGVSAVMGALNATVTPIVKLVGPAPANEYTGNIHEADGVV